MGELTKFLRVNRQTQFRYFLKNQNVHTSPEKSRVQALKTDKNSLLELNLNFHHVWQKIQNVKKKYFFEIFGFFAKYAVIFFDILDFLPSMMPLYLFCIFWKFLAFFFRSPSQMRKIAGRLKLQLPLLQAWFVVWAKASKHLNNIQNIFILCVHF